MQIVHTVKTLESFAVGLSLSASSSSLIDIAGCALSLLDPFTNVTVNGMKNLSVHAGMHVRCM